MDSIHDNTFSAFCGSLLEHKESEDGGSQHVWELEETLVLVEAKSQMDDEEEEDQYAKNNTERWQCVSELCAEDGILRTSAQCMNRWNEIWGDFKSVFEYEQRIPARRRSYFDMNANERAFRKLPLKFELRLYEAMSNRFDGHTVAIRRDVMVDTSADYLGSFSILPSCDLQDENPSEHKNETMLGEDGVPGDESLGLQHKECELSSLKEQTSGKKRLRPAQKSGTGKELQDTSKKLMDLLQTDQAKGQEELLDSNAWIARQHTLARELPDIQKQINEERVQVMKEIANAIMSLTSAIAKK